MQKARADAQQLITNVINMMFVKLLVGLYRPTAGNLCVNGVDAVDVDSDALRGGSAW
jgi:hypothetical protein